MDTNITFEYENKDKTSVKIIRNNKTIGRVWSEQLFKDSSLTLPYPHDKTNYCINSVQICGFDKMSEIWSCGPFKGKKDCVIHFIPFEDKYYQEKRKKYFEYVKGFMESEIKEVEGYPDMRITQLNEREDKPIETLQAFESWCLHNL